MLPPDATGQVAAMKPTWSSAKHLVAHFDGAATEIFVTGLPLSHVPVVMAILADLPALEVTCFRGQALEPVEPFNATWKSQFVSTPSASCVHVLRSANGTERHLQIHLWCDAAAGALEVEIVFWNDLTFPHDLSASELEHRLDILLSLADACRNGIHGARCVLASEHNGPVDELLKKGGDFVVEW